MEPDNDKLNALRAELAEKKAEYEAIRTNGGHTRNIVADMYQIEWQIEDALGVRKERAPIETAVLNESEEDEEG